MQFNYVIWFTYPFIHICLYARRFISALSFYEVLRLYQTGRSMAPQIPMCPRPQNVGYNFKCGAVYRWEQDYNALNLAYRVQSDLYAYLLHGPTIWLYGIWIAPLKRHGPLLPGQKTKWCDLVVYYRICKVINITKTTESHHWFFCQDCSVSRRTDRNDVSIVSLHIDWEAPSANFCVQHVALRFLFNQSELLIYSWGGTFQSQWCSNTVPLQNSRPVSNICCD